ERPLRREGRSGFRVWPVAAAMIRRARLVVLSPGRNDGRPGETPMTLVLNRAFLAAGVAGCAILASACSAAETPAAPAEAETVAAAPAPAADQTIVEAAAASPAHTTLVAAV